MTAGPAYRFETEAQLKTCLSMALPQELTLDPGNAVPIQTLPPGTRCFAVSGASELAWIDRKGVLRRDLKCGGPLLRRASRMVFASGKIWVLDEGTLSLIDGERLELLDSFTLGGACDIASDGAGGLWILNGAIALHWDGRGRELGRLAFGEAVDSIGAIGRSLALLSLRDNQVIISEGASSIAVALGPVLGEAYPAFIAERLIGSSSLLLFAGKFVTDQGQPDQTEQEGILLLDQGGNPAGYGAWEEKPPSALVLEGSDLIALFETGGRSELLRFTGIGNIGARRLITPALDSDTLAGDWLRAEVSALVGDGATISLRFASTKDDDLRLAATKLFSDPSRTVAARALALDQLLTWGDKSPVYVANVASGSLEAQDFAFPLFEANGNILWIDVTIEANGSAPPRFKSLVVRHDSPSLMDHLPAVFKTPEGDLGNVLRNLVFVLETTAQELDEEIGRLGERLDPRRTSEQWLPDLAGLLGLPFDETLRAGQQRRIITRAVDILTGRGTQRGIAALIEALFGERGYRVTDRTARLAPVMLGGAGISGSLLPAFLTGASSRVPRLNARLILGKTGLCELPCSSASVGRAPELLVEIAASASEQRRLAGPVQQMIQSLLPAGISLRLRWRGRGFAHHDVISTLSEPELAVIGDPPAVGSGRLGGDRSPRLGNGIPIEHRLQ